MKAVATAPSAVEVLQRIALHAHVQLEEGKAFIFFDEIQKSPELITMVKFLV